MDEDFSNEDEKNKEDNKDFRSCLKTWGIEFNISQVALKPLLLKLNDEFNINLPKDPHTLMGTPRVPLVIKNIEGGQYWHQGLEFCLRKCFHNIESPLSIKLNINIDGLPIYENGTDKFWPILFNVHEMQFIKPMIIGLFYGKTKPHKVEEFLEGFVREAIKLLEDEISINGNHLKISIHAFICDSPARPFIKGVINFNNQNGCLKCCTVGFYSKTVGCNVFSRKNCFQRNDAAFRTYLYKDHNQFYDPK